jgi:hypothetical protein
MSRVLIATYADSSLTRSARRTPRRRRRRARPRLAWLRWRPGAARPAPVPRPSGSRAVTAEDPA